MRRRLILPFVAVMVATVGTGSAWAHGERLPVPGTSDVNGDGLDDVALAGAPYAPGDEPPLRPRPFVAVFGKRDRAFVDIRSPGAWGSVYEGPFVGSPTVVGDVNGDGRADMAAAAMIVVGAGGQVFRIRNGARASRDVAGVGDVNGDGIDDLAVYDGQTPTGRLRRNAAVYLIYGSHTPADVDVAHLGSRGTRIRVPRQRAHSAWESVQLSGAGDMDGDGIGDVAVTADWVPSRSCRFDRNRAVHQCDGRVWVLYGRRAWPAAIGANAGFATAPRGERFGELHRADAAGDLDGDGYDDLLLSLEERAATPVAAVLWGSRHRHRGTRSLGARTSRLRDRFDNGIVPIGDFDGDGRADLVGEPDPPGDCANCTRFRTFLLRGRRWSGVRSLVPRRARAGHRLFRSDESDFRAVGDVNGDRRADLAMPPSFGADDPHIGWVLFGARSSTPVRVTGPRLRGFHFGVR